MKISVLVAQYFYQHRVLNLPGIGSFYLDGMVDVQNFADKSSRELLEHIHFAQKTITKPDNELIDFIRKHTGKIRPLAESDLETFVADGKLMLNIGKPFHIEGIGTLQKNREGVYEFTAGLPVVQRLDPPPALAPLERETDKPVKKKSVFDEQPYEARNNTNRRLAVILGIVVGLGIIIWGGYALFSKKVETANVSATGTNGADTSMRTSQYLTNIDTPQKARAGAISRDSIHANPNAQTTKTGAAANALGTATRYKFVLETFKYKSSALSRYNKLKPRVNLEALADSTIFRIVISLPGTPADTARLKDSLHNWYWGARNKIITIEQ